MEAGAEEILGKVEEETEEVVEAAKTGSKPELVHETSDLLFHLLVLMAYKGIKPEDIQGELERRRK
jgi:phosphoribosyl-ATP pyrophosphohydrolase/phosphoribosyl-AMP cyclohydrolase